MSIDEEKVKPKKKKRISVAAAKSKGRRLQQKTAKAISELLEIPYGKDELIASREMGQSGTDVRLIGEARKKFPYSIECKQCEKWSVFSWVDQAKSNQETNTDWLLICGRNNFPPVVVIDWTAYYYLTRRLPGYKIEGRGIYDKKAWKLPHWVELARAKDKNKEPWSIHCRKGEEYVVAVMDFDHFFEMQKLLLSSSAA